MKHKYAKPIILSIGVLLLVVLTGFLLRETLLPVFGGWFSTEAMTTPSESMVDASSTEPVTQQPSEEPSESTQPDVAASELIPAPEAATIPTPEATPESLPEATPEAQPEATPSPESEPKPEPTPAPTPTPAPAQSTTTQGTPLTLSPAFSSPEPLADGTDGPLLTLSTGTIRQGDMLAVWLENVPSDPAYEDIWFRASWLGKLVKAHEWNGKHVALIQATVSVNPNTWSVRAMKVERDANGNPLPAEEIPGTRVLIHIEKRNFEQHVFSVSEDLEKTRSQENLNDDGVKVAAAKSNGSSIPLWEQNFLMPIEGGKAKGFGLQRIINGKLSYTHSGVDVSAGAGTPIYAPAAGRVVFSGPLVVAGTSVILDHGLGMYSSLVHMSKTAADVGDIVAAGDLVGYVGSTGFSTGPHLHWTLTVNGNIVDAEYLMRHDPIGAIR